MLLLAPACSAGPISAEAQRELFRETLASIRAGNWSRERRNVRRLENYALYGYLYEAALHKSPSEFSDNDVRHLIRRYEGTPLAPRIRTRWIQYLGYKKRWQSFLSFYEEGGAYGTELRCVYAEALTRQGRASEAGPVTEAIWLTGSPLPDSCDPLVYNWLRNSGREPELRWARAKLAMAAGEASLVNFLLRPVDLHPRVRTLLKDPMQFTVAVPQLKKMPQRREITTYTLQRIARRDYEVADTLWLTHRRTLGLSLQQNDAIRQLIARQLLADGSHADALGWLIKHDPEGSDPYLTEWRVRLALKAGNWEKVKRYIDMLPAEVAAEPQWQYWRARSVLASGDKSGARRVLAQLTDLASERGYYSFLSAELIGVPYQLNITAVEDRKLQSEIAKHPGIIRSRELLAVDELWLSRLEWSEAVKPMDNEHQYAAARLASQWEWHHTAIKTVNKASELGDLALRFPTAYKDHFVTAAKLHNLSTPWLYSVARQESAFDPQARSHAGARGLMQLMPGTARLVARDIGTRVSNQQLHIPTVNIQLGSHYLAQMLNQYGGNRILATAAYNAGPGRIDKVLMQQPQALPFDIWIENLPYTETRGYIRNILAYSVIYSRLLGEFDAPMVLPAEQEIDADRMMQVIADKDRIEKLKTLRQVLAAKTQ